MRDVAVSKQPLYNPEGASLFRTCIPYPPKVPERPISGNMGLLAACRSHSEAAIRQGFWGMLRQNRCRRTRP